MRLHFSLLLLLVGLTADCLLGLADGASLRMKRAAQRSRFFSLGNDFNDGLAGLAGGFATSYFANQFLCSGRSRNQGRSAQTAQIGAGLGVILGALTNGCG